jgi:hypothetical protein
LDESRYLGYNHPRIAMSTDPPDPQQTYAIVVGIEQYQAGNEWSLNGPARDARVFADWLTGKRVPAANMLLYLSPLAANQDLAAAPGPTVQPATRDTIYKGITQTVRNAKGSLLYFFWAGHGILTTEGSRRLLYADADQHTKLNLDFTSLLASLRTDYFAGFAQQIFIVDTCANYIPDRGMRQSLPVETFAYGGQPLNSREQFVLLAAKAGDQARNLSARGAGLFSEVVLKVLAEDAQAWPPDMVALATRVEEQFAQLRATGQAEQTPTYYWYRDQADHDSTSGQLPTVVREAAPGAAVSFAAIKLSTLQTRWEALISDYEAANNQLLYTLEAIQANKIKRQIESLAGELAALEQEMAPLRASVAQ